MLFENPEKLHKLMHPCHKHLEYLKGSGKMPVEKVILNSNASGLLISLAYFFIHIVLGYLDQ